jgi:hypothetical protein
MNKIIESFLNTHILEYSLEQTKQDSAFEHFINRCVINKYTVDRFDPSEILTGKGEIGLDGIAIIINERLITSLEVAKEILSNAQNFKTRFVFIQAKTSEKFDGGEISTFIYGVRSFFENKENRPVTNEKIETLIAIKDYIYSKSVQFDGNPILDLCYVCCGKWEEANGLRNRAETDYESLVQSQNFGKIDFIPYDSDKIITVYKELKKKVQKSFVMTKSISFPSINGISQAYLGLVRCKEYVSILKDSDGNIMSNIFEDNVRDFQGYNLVNQEIRDTLISTEKQEPFAVLNNGITIVTKSLKTTGDTFHIHDYQIVNGCQTSYVLYDNYESLNENTYVAIKIIETTDSELADRVIFTTNRQTEVKSEAFESTKKFHKKLQDYFNAIDVNFRLYYERRSKQYEQNDGINKNRVVTLASQTSAFVAMFLNEPHSIHRYYGEILKAYSGKLYLEDHHPEPYYISSYYLYLIEKMIKEASIHKKYKAYKYHLACIVRALVVGRKLVPSNSKEMKKMCTALFEVAKSITDFQKNISKAIDCLDKVLETNTGTPLSELNRSKEITLRALELAAKESACKEKSEYLNKNSEVSCEVKKITNSFVYVKIQTEDIRDFGSIHISKMTGRYISNLNDEVKVGDVIKAIINDDNFNNQYGWELSCIK